jgi:hypothetical protein
MASDGGGGFLFITTYINLEGVISETNPKIAEGDWYLVPSNTYDSAAEDWKIIIANMEQQLNNITKP